MTATILGISAVQPAHAIEQRDAAEMAGACCTTKHKDARLLGELYRRTTVQQRGATLLKPHGDGSVDADSLHWFFPRASSDGDGGVDHRGPTTAERMRRFREDAPPLAEDACRRALDDAGVEAGGVTHLITVTCTGFASPGVETELIKRLDLRRDVVRTQVGFMGCHAALNGLQVARAMAESNASARVLMVCVELCSLHFQYGWDTEQLVANALFADGAAAAVIGGEDDDQRDDGTVPDAPPQRQGLWRLADTASRYVDETEPMMSWHIGDHGFEMTLANEVPRAVARSVRPWLDTWLAKRGLAVADVGSWAIHPGGPRIVTGVAERLGVDDRWAAISRDVLQQCGNMSSATVLFILQRLREAEAPAPCVALSFGPGLIAEAALLE